MVFDMKKSLSICILMLLQASLLFAQGGEMLYPRMNPYCILGDENSEKIRHSFIEEPTMVVYSVPHALISTEAVPDDIVSVFIKGSWGDPLGFAGSFSDDELVVIIEQDSFKKGIDMGMYNTKGKLSLPLITADSEAGKAIADLIFTLTDAYVIMKNPYDPAKDVYLSGIAYVKFKGTALIEVPPVE